MTLAFSLRWRVRDAGVGKGARTGFPDAGVGKGAKTGFLGAGRQARGSPSGQSVLAEFVGGKSFGASTTTTHCTAFSLLRLF